jgi:hypothetical protein
VKRWLVGAVLCAWAGTVAAADAETQPPGTPAASKSLMGALGVAPAGPVNSDEDDRVDPDRPHFPEASTTVGF